MAVTNLDTLLYSLSNSTNIPFFKSSIATQLSAGWTSLWRGTGGYPIQGAIPTTSAICTSATVGAFPLPVTSGSNVLYVANISQNSSIVSSFLLYDRLNSMGGLSGTVTPAAQASLVTLTAPAAEGRCLASGADVDWFLEWYSATGSTASNATVAVTYDDDSTGNLAAIAVGGTAVAASQMRQLIPAVNGRTIKAVNSVTLSASTLTAGNFGVTAGKRLFGYTCPIASLSINSDFGATGFPIIKSTSCLWMVSMPGTTSSGIQFGNLVIAHG